MSITLRGLFAPALFVAFAAGQAQAGQLTLDGLTLNSSLLNSDFTTASTIADGTNFVIIAQIPDAPVSTDTGLAVYSPLSITVDVGASVYQVDLSGGGISVELRDIYNLLTGTYMVTLLAGGGGLSPEYNTTTPPGFDVSILPPESVVFSDYITSYPGFSSVQLPLIGGSGEIEDCGEGGDDDPGVCTQYLQLGYDPNVGVNASLTTPEPGTLVLLGAGLLALGSLRRRRTS